MKVHFFMFIGLGNLIKKAHDWLNRGMHFLFSPIKSPPDVLIPLIQQALRHTTYTFVIGAYNKVSDLDKTNKWSSSIFYRQPGEYQSSTPVEKLPSSKAPIKKWSMILQSTPIPKVGITPIKFNFLEIFPYPDLLDFATNVIAAYKLRAGNCGLQCLILANFLWKKSSGKIHRIEIINADEFDHSFVIINRQQNSDLHKPNTWDNAWIIDPWREGNKFYHAKKFKEEILATVDFCMKQHFEINKDQKCKAHMEVIYNKYLKQNQKSFQMPITAKFGNLPVSMSSSPLRP